MYIHMYIHVHMCIYMRRSISLSAAGYILRLPFERESLAHIVINIIIRYKKEGLRWIARALYLYICIYIGIRRRGCDGSHGRCGREGRR